jgi:hypothetical protein
LCFCFELNLPNVASHHSDGWETKKHYLYIIISKYPDLLLLDLPLSLVLIVISNMDLFLYPTGVEKLNNDCSRVYLQRSADWLAEWGSWE